MVHPQQIPPALPAARSRVRHHSRSMTVRVGAFELTKKGGTRYEWRDPYHFAVSLTWPGFLLMFVILELALNTLFATLYLLQPGAIANAKPGSLADAFFFSLETLATVGYGVMAPATLYGHIISAIEIICGMAFVAIMTGLTFVRFSRPRGRRLLWAEKAVVTTHNSKRTLMIRLANDRASMLTNASARLSALIAERSQEGKSFRSVYDLPLLRPRLPVFPLTWTVMHPIDEASPLYRYRHRDYAEADIRLFLSILATDSALAAQIGDMKDYGPADVVFGMRYADAVSRDERGNTIADLDRLSELEDDGSVAPPD
jgi:inward rectifier potassium channel